MNITSEQIIAGIPAIKLRKALPDYLCVEYFARQLCISESEAKETIEQLEKDGYLELEENGYWSPTSKGRKLRAAKASKPISRKTANQKVQELIQIAKSINADPKGAVWVNKLVLFGSYVDSDADCIGDVDCAVDMEMRECVPKNDINKKIDWIYQYANRVGRGQNLGWERLLHFPFDHGMKMLKNRSTAISLIDWSIFEYLSDKPEGKVIYKRVKSSLDKPAPNFAQIKISPRIKSNQQENKDNDNM